MSDDHGAQSYSEHEKRPDEPLMIGDRMLPFITRLYNDDDQIAVLRGQLMIEVRLIELLSIRIPGFDKVAPWVEFSKKCRTALDEKLIVEPLYQSLLALARLRNKFSHPPLKMELTVTDERQFVKTLPSYLIAIKAAWDEHSSDTRILGKDTRLLIALLYVHLSAILDRLRVDPLAVIEIPRQYSKEWLRERLLLTVADSNESYESLEHDSRELRRVKLLVNSLGRSDRAAFRPWLLARYDKNGSLRPGDAGSTHGAGDSCGA